MMSDLDEKSSSKVLMWLQELAHFTSMSAINTSLLSFTLNDNIPPLRCLTVAMISVKSIIERMYDLISTLSCLVIPLE